MKCNIKNKIYNKKEYGFNIYNIINAECWGRIMANIIEIENRSEIVIDRKMIFPFIHQCSIDDISNLVYMAPKCESLFRRIGVLACSFDMNPDPPCALAIESYDEFLEFSQAGTMMEYLLITNSDNANHSPVRVLTNMVVFGKLQAHIEQVIKKSKLKDVEIVKLLFEIKKKQKKDVDLLKMAPDCELNVRLMCKLVLMYDEDFDEEEFLTMRNEIEATFEANYSIEINRLKNLQ